MDRYNRGRSWGSDTPVSMPEPVPSERKVYVDMGGFGFTIFGIVQNFRETDLEAYRPTFTPVEGF